MVTVVTMVSVVAMVTVEAMVTVVAHFQERASKAYSMFF